MRTTWLYKISFLTLCGVLPAFPVLAQEKQQNTSEKVNFGYSQNPKSKTKREARTNNDLPATNSDDAASNFQPVTTEENKTIAQKTFEIAKRANLANAAPTEIYRVGSGDVLFISLQNAPAKESNYFTVLGDGSIDYPLAGEMVSVTGLTVEEIEDLLREKIKLYENAQISVKLREYASHSITVLGLVEKSGEQFLKREAVPLYLVRAEAVVLPKATGVTIKRAAGETEKFDFKDSKYENVLVFPGDIIEFTGYGSASVSSSAPQFYYIGGEINSAGQKDFHDGITLTQAILASGGLRKSDTKRVVIRRKNEQGLLVPTEYNLKDIKNGKAPDPVLLAGDTIEIGN